MLEVRGLSVAYGQHRALDDVSVQVKPGEIVVILGANGAGKSSLLKAISGVSEGRVTGSVMLDGEEQVGRRAHDIVEAGIALVPEGRGVFPDLTVRENLTLGAHGPRARGEEAANLDRVLSLFPKLAERAGQQVRTMSGGEQQMVAIGRAMMSNPMILTLDEPSLGLSPLLCKELFRNLARVRDLGLGVLLVEQNARQSLAIADRGYLLENARIVHQDTAAALANDPAVQAAYLGAGGAAAPHTHDAAPPKVDAAAIAAEAIQRFEMRPRTEVTRSADAVLGRSVADLVAQASERSTRAVAETRATRPAMPDTAAHGDRLRATLDDIARAAAAARRTGPVVIRERPMPDRAAPSPTSAARAAPAEPGPRPVIEIYRAPRVEVYRRRPSGEFHRD
jgi:branched-chain amino acid transport system ATP-binding protein